jgi:hypothetical protein
MGKYLLENVHAAYPEARCAIVVGSRGAMIRDLLTAYPWIEVIEANRREPLAVLGLIYRFWRSDLVTTLYTGGTLNLSTKLVARLIARRGALIGFADPSPLNRFLFDRTLPTHGRAGVPRTHECAVLRTAGVPLAYEEMRFEFLPQPGLLARLGLVEKKYVVVGLFSGTAARGLSERRRQDLLDALMRVYADTTFVFLGTKKEREQLAALSLPPRSIAVDTSLQEAAALIRTSLGMISLGTGTSHIAALLRVPLVVLVACQGRQWVGTEQFGDAPILVRCKPEACPQGHLPDAPCINSLDMDAVAQDTKEFFSAKEKRVE